MRAGIDIGGTKTNMGIFNDLGLIKSHIVKTQDLEVIVNEFYDFVLKEIGSPDEIETIGVGLPGTVDNESGTVIFAPNLGWRDLNIKGPFQKKFSASILLAQDTKCAALGEFCYGAGQGLSDILCLTVGTGIGCGIIINKKLHMGKYNTSGEFGHMVAIPGGRSCNCGKNGCLEAYSSGTGMALTYREYAKKGKKSDIIAKPDMEVTAEDIFAAAKKGCPVSLEIIDGAVEILANGIINSVNLLGPELVVLSGGISNENDLFTIPLFNKVNSGIYSLLKDKICLAVAKLGSDSPMYGAEAIYRFL